MDRVITNTKHYKTSLLLGYYNVIGGISVRVGTGSAWGSMPVSVGMDSLTIIPEKPWTRRRGVIQGKMCWSKLTSIPRKMKQQSTIRKRKRTLKTRGSVPWNGVGDAHRQGRAIRVGVFRRDFMEPSI